MGGKADEDTDESLEEALEQMRREVARKGDLTPVTPESFAKWKETWLRREADEKAKAAKKASKARGGHKQLSGRALFAFDPSMFTTTDDTVDLTDQLNKLRHPEDDEKDDDK